MYRKLVATVTLAVTCAAFAACAGAPPSITTGPGGGTGNPASGAPVPPGQPAGSIDSCQLLTDDEIRAATGQGVLERAPSTLTQVFSSVCDIELDGGGFLTVSVLPTGGRAMYETSFEPFIGDGDAGGFLDEAVTGLGDKAGRSGDDVVMVLKDDVLFDIQYIEFGRPDKFPTVHYLAERVLARLACIATGCPALPVPPAPTPGPPTPGPTRAAIDPGSLPTTGAQARVVNLYSEDGQPVTVDVYAYAWSDAEAREVASLVATVPYGESSDWFNPGLVESPFGGEPYTRVDIFREGDSGTSPLVGTGEFLGAGTVTTIAVWQEEVFEGQPSAWVQTIYAEHPDYPIPEAPEGQGLLITRDTGLRAEEDPPILYASVGDGCLVHPLSDPSFPSPQPIANDLVIPAGSHTLTVHEEPFGELPTCESKALGPGVPVTVGAGDRFLAFTYRLPGDTDINLLVVPFDAP